jgi:hypothetical protein
MIHDKLLPWHMASTRKLWVTHATLGIYWAEAFWTAWQAVMFPEREK